MARSRTKILVGSACLALAFEIVTDVLPAVLGWALIATSAILFVWGIAPHWIERFVAQLPSKMRLHATRFLGVLDKWIEETASDHGDSEPRSLRLLSAVQKLLRYPDATQDTAEPQTVLEEVTDPLQRRLFDLLMTYDETDIGKVPGIGLQLREFFDLYYEFRQSTLRFEADLLAKIKGGKDWFPQAWRIYQRYVTMRLFGLSKEKIVAGGNFLNYSITWDSAEKKFEMVSGEATVTSAAAELDATSTRLDAIVVALKESVATGGVKKVRALSSTPKATRSL